MTTQAELAVIGRIATLDGSGYGWAEAIALGGGRVIASGTMQDVEPLMGPTTTVWRLRPDQAAMPSLTDAHLHLTAAALAADQPDLTGLDTAGVIEAIGRRHEALVADGDADGWLLGHGWSFAALGAPPRAEQLDAAAPGRPVALWAHDHHSRWLSARAIQLAGLAAIADPPSGRIERDADGRPTGVMYEAAAGLVDAAVPAPSLGDVDWAIGGYAQQLAALGVTAVHDPGPLAPEPMLMGGPVHYRAIADGGHLPLRVVASVREEQLDRAIEIGFRSGQDRDADPADRYRDGWLKLFADGAIGSRTAAMLAPYEPDEAAGPPPGGPLGMALRSREALAEVAGRAAEAGIASQIHAIGDAAVRDVLDVIAGLPAVAGMRHRVEHAQLVDAEDVGRFGALSVPASVQPCHLSSDAAAMRAAWGTRASGAFPLAALDAGGASMPFGTDAPVEPPDPWRGIAVAVTRRAPGLEAPFHPEQAISLSRALRAACLDPPRSAGIDDQGHLAVGARADLLVIPSAMFDGPPDAERIATTRPLATLLDGAVVYRSDDFDP